MKYLHTLDARTLAELLEDCNPAPDDTDLQPIALEGSAARYEFSAPRC